MPDGEPTLDLNLYKEIKMLKIFAFLKAIITNSSLLFERDAREALLKFDWVSLKIDSVEEEIWRKINRPHKKLNLSNILEGVIEFSKSFKWELVTETMLVNGMNDSLESAEKISKFIKKINPSTSFLSIPIRA